MDREPLLEGIDQSLSQLGKRFRKKIQDEQLTFSQYVVLKFLSNGSLSMRDIADNLQVSMAAATGIVDRMVAAKVVERRRSDEDRRMVWVTLTGEGVTRFTELQRKRGEFVRQTFSKLSDDELHQLSDMLQRVSEANT